MNPLATDDVTSDVEAYAAALGVPVSEAEAWLAGAADLPIGDNYDALHDTVHHDGAGHQQRQEAAP